LYGRRNAEAYVSLYEGSQWSFVTQDLARTLTLQPSGKEAINISSFGATHPTNQLFDITTINLLTKSVEAVLLSVLIVPFIATPLQNTIITVYYTSTAFN